MIKPIFLYRHALTTRLTHWINALCIVFLLMSGAQIFLAHPALYVGQAGFEEDRALVEIGAKNTFNGDLSGFLRIRGWTVDTTGYLGAVKDSYGEWEERALPYWATLPTQRNLAGGRRWHFFFAWMFAANLLLYYVVGLWSGHIVRDLAPTTKHLHWRSLVEDFKDHIFLRLHHDKSSSAYNPMQRIAYFGVVAILLPGALLTGLTMSPGMDAIFPWLLDLFGGRQTARTIHFLIAASIVSFLAVHLAMVIAVGPWNAVKSMITGKIKISSESGNV